MARPAESQADSWGLFATPAVTAEALPEGAFAYRNALALPEFPRSILERLDHWAALAPERVFLGERAGAGWTRLTYLEAKRRSDDLAAALINGDVSADAPLMLIAPNGIDHALLALAAMRIGVPVAPVSPALAAAGDSTRLAALVDLLKPGGIYCGTGVATESLLPLAAAMDCRVITAGGGANGGLAMRDMARAGPAAVAARFARSSPDDPAKILFTSGSTGSPKGVVVTQRMMCSNAAGLATVWPFLLEHPPLLVDWLPWNHVFGGNVCFNLTLYYGGSLYVDDGRPVPEGIARTVENLRDIGPNMHFNVPLGYEAIVPHLERDESFARRFSSGLFFLFNAAAALPESTRDRLGRAVRAAAGRSIPVIGAWGATETSPFATVSYFESPDADNVGVPFPGTSIKMVPDGDRAELRVKGPNVMPGYWRQPEATRAAFDEDGYYRIGDAGRLAEASRPEAGIRFMGRIAENFKLTSGTWVNVGVLRLDLIEATKPLIDDVVITGHGRDALGALLFPSVAGCRELLGPASPSLTVAEILAHPAIIEGVRRGLRKHWAKQRGASTRIERFRLLPTPPNRAAGEVTEKGSLNQRAVLSARAEEVLLLEREGHPVAAGGVETDGSDERRA